MTDSSSTRSSAFGDYLDRLVAAVSDGTPVDWAEAVAQATTDGDRALVRHLRMLAALAAACDPTATDTLYGAPASTGPMGPVPTSFKDGRFVVEHVLGKGAFGIVYKAYDKERNAHVALKAFTRRGADSLYDFKNEFRVLADFTHPNLASLYELFGDERSWLIAMELVPGVDFVSFVRDGGHARGPLAEAPDGLPPCRCNLTRLGDAMIQLYQAVAYLHGAGKVHCDIKPSNVLVTSDGQVKVVDFGLATDMSQLLTDHAVKIRGTPAYAAPEQAAGLLPTAASDWYSVGVMLFEALTGQRPFESTITEMLAAKQSREAPAPRSLVAGVPDALNELCCRLLERRPEARPGDADVLHALGRIWPSASISTRPAGIRTDAAPLVGRQPQLEVLAQAFAARTRLPQIVFVHGASGMGKSFLVRSFLARVRDDSPGVVILEGRCSERESVPYKALDSLVDQLAQYLGTLPGEMLDLLPRECAALARLFPVLRRIEVIERNWRAARATDLQELRRRGSVALRDLLRRIAARHPLILVIDDLQWADADSARLLDEMLFGEGGSPLLFIGCHRTEEAASNAALRTLLAKTEATAGRGQCSVNTILMTELPPREARALARTLMDQHSTRMPVDSIVEESRGSPLFIHQLVQYAAARATDDSQTTPDPGSGLLTLDSVIRARTDGFGRGARRLLEVLAVFGGPLKLSLAAEVADLGEAALGDSVALRTGRLARSRIADIEEKLEVYHDRIREAIVADIPAASLKTLHARLAHALERAPDADPDALVHHFQGAGEHQTAAKYAVVAGDRAADALAFARASKLYRFALDFGEFEDEGRSVRVKLADALAASGHGYEAAHAYLEAAGRADHADVFELKRRASEQLLQGGHLDEGLSVVGDVLNHAGLRLAKTPTRALLSLLALRARLSLRGLGFTQRDEKALAPEALLPVDASWSVTTGLAIVDHIRSAEFGARNLLLALDAGEPLRIVRALAMELAYTSISGAKSRPYNEKLIAIAEPLAARIPNAEARGLLTLAKGSAAYMQGQWPVARELCEQARQTLREQCTRVAWQIDTAEFYTLLSSFYLGDMRDIARRLPALLKEARERDALYAETILRTRIGFLACLTADDVAGAETAVRQGMQRWSHKGFHNQHYYEMVASAETQLYAGHGADAWAAVERKWRDLRRTLLLRVQPVQIESVHLRARTAIAAARASAPGKRAALVAQAERGAGEIRKTRAPWATGLAELTSSGTASLRGSAPEAIAHLEAAERIFDRERMGLFGAVARRRRGELLGAADGDALVQSANAWMREQSIANPARFADMLAPGEFADCVRLSNR